MNEQQIAKKIEELIEQRDVFVANANRRVAELNGAIAALKEILDDDEPTKGNE